MDVVDPALEATGGLTARGEDRGAVGVALGQAVEKLGDEERIAAALAMEGLDVQPPIRR